MITEFDKYNTRHRFDLSEIINDMAYTKDTKKGIVLKNRYTVGIIDYLKEVFVGRFINFLVMDRTQPNQFHMTGVVEDVDYYIYHPEEIFIKVKIGNFWYMIFDTRPVDVFDWEPGPLYKQYVLEKEAKRYNL
jgi:hypothetical protein